MILKAHTFEGIRYTCILIGLTEFDVLLNWLCLYELNWIRGRGSLSGTPKKVYRKHINNLYVYEI